MPTYERNGQFITFPDDEQEFQKWWAEICEIAGFDLARPLHTISTQEICDAAKILEARKKSN